MKSHDEVRSRVDALEAAIAACQNDGCQDDEELGLATFCVGALDWASDKATPAAKRFDSLCQRFDTQLKRMTARKKERPAKVAAAPVGDPW